MTKGTVHLPHKQKLQKAMDIVLLNTHKKSQRCLPFVKYHVESLPTHSCPKKVPSSFNRLTPCLLSQETPHWTEEDDRDCEAVPVGALGHILEELSPTESDVVKGQNNRVLPMLQTQRSLL